MAKTTKNEPTGLELELGKSEAFIEKNLKGIIIVIVAIIVCVCGYYIYKNHMDEVEKKAEVALYKSQTYFAQEQYETALNGDSISRTGFLKIIDQYSGTKTANLAKLYAAICYANTNKYDEAIKYFEDFDQEDDQMISPASIAALGNCYIQKGNTEKGVKLLVEAADKADNNTLSPIFLLQAGEVYESINQNDKALELYNRIKKDYFRSPLSQDIDKYINRATK